MPDRTGQAAGRTPPRSIGPRKRQTAGKKVIEIGISGRRAVVFFFRLAATGRHAKHVRLSGGLSGIDTNSSAALKSYILVNMMLGLPIVDPFRLTLAFGPVAIYLLLLGMVNLSRRPLMVSGGRDAAALALAMTGMLIVGPFELFLPQASLLHYGPYAWVMALTFYGLCVAMGILMLRPRLVIYNISADKLRPILAEVVARLDSDARWAGDSLVLPNLEVQLSIDNFRVLRNVSLKSVGGNQDLHGWRRLEQALAGALNQETVSAIPGD